MAKVGRPKKDPEERLTQSVRTLVTDRVKQYLIDKAAEQGFTEAQLLRLALYQMMLPWMDSPLDDPTFREVEK